MVHVASGPMWGYVFGQLLSILSIGSGGALPLGIPPAPPDPAIQQAAPADCLFYLSKAGVAAPDPHSLNQTEALLAEPEVKQLLTAAEQLITKFVQANAARQGTQIETAAADAITAVKILLARPLAAYVSSVQPAENVIRGGLTTVQPPKIEGGLIISLGDQAQQVHALADKYWPLLLNAQPDKAGPADVAGQKWNRIQPAPDAPVIYWTFRDNYLLAAAGQSEAAALWKRIGGPVPSWLTTLQTKLAVPRPAMITYVNAKRIIHDFAPLAGPQGPALLEALGLTKITSIASVNGLDATGSLARTLVALDGPPVGTLSLLAGKPLAAADLRPIPADATLALAWRLDLAATFKTVVSAVDKIQPGTQQQVEAALDQTVATSGIDARQELIAALGDTWCLYNSPGEGGLVITGLTAVVSVKDHAKLASGLDKLRALAQLAASMQASGDRPAPRIVKAEFAGQAIYTVDPGKREFFLAPSWCLTDKQLILATFPQNIKAYLSRDKSLSYRSLAEEQTVAEALRTDHGPTALSYQNTPDLVRLFYPLVQVWAAVAVQQLRHEHIDIDLALLPSAATILRHLRPALSEVRRTPDGILLEQRQTLGAGGGVIAAPLVIGLTLPAVSSARSAARRAASANNLKQDCPVHVQL